MVGGGSVVGADQAAALQIIVAAGQSGCGCVRRGDAQGERDDGVQIFLREELGAFGADVGRVDHDVARDFALDAEGPVLVIGVDEIFVNQVLAIGGQKRARGLRECRENAGVPRGSAVVMAEVKSVLTTLGDEVERSRRCC